MGPHSVRYLINEDDDILVANVGSGLSAAHLASLTDGTRSLIYAFGADMSDKQYTQILENFERLGVSGGQIIFLQLSA